MVRLALGLPRPAHPDVHRSCGSRVAMCVRSEIANDGVASRRRCATPTGTHRVDEDLAIAADDPQGIQRNGAGGQATSVDGIGSHAGGALGVERVRHTNQSDAWHQKFTVDRDLEVPVRAFEQRRRDR